MKAIQKRGFDRRENLLFKCRRIPVHVQLILIKWCVCRKGAHQVPVRSSNTSPVCVKVSGALNLLDTQSGGQVFHSDVINHSAHNTPSQCRRLLFPFPNLFLSEGSRGSFSTPEAGLLFSFNSDMFSDISHSNWLRT